MLKISLTYAFMLLCILVNASNNLNVFALENSTDYVNYSDKKYKISLNMPRDAVVQEKGTPYDLAQILQINTNYGLSLEVSMFPLDSSTNLDLKTYVDAKISEIRSNTNPLVTNKIISGPTETTVDEEKAYEMVTSYIIRGMSNSALVSQTYILFHDNILYLFDFRASSQTIDSFGTEIDEIRNSIKFLN